MTQRTSLRLPLEYFRAHRQVTKAIQRGDIAAAHTWMDAIERLLKIAEREAALVGSRPAPVPKSRKGPVMLDPKGYSPGGTPNWFINQQRLERAGLKASDVQVQPDDG